MVCLGSLELERRSLIHCSSVVLTASHYSEGSAGLKHQFSSLLILWVSHLHVHSVDGSGLASDVSIAGASVSQEHVSKLLSPLTNNNNPDNEKLWGGLEHSMIITFDCHWTRPGP